MSRVRKEFTKYFLDDYQKISPAIETASAKQSVTISDELNSFIQSIQSNGNIDGSDAPSNSTRKAISNISNSLSNLSNACIKYSEVENAYHILKEQLDSLSKGEKKYFEEINNEPTLEQFKYLVTNEDFTSSYKYDYSNYDKKHTDWDERITNYESQLDVLSENIIIIKEQISKVNDLSFNNIMSENFNLKLPSVISFTPADINGVLAVVPLLENIDTNEKYVNSLGMDVYKGKKIEIDSELSLIRFINMCYKEQGTVKGVAFESSQVINNFITKLGYEPTNVSELAEFMVTKIGNSYWYGGRTRKAYNDTSFSLDGATEDPFVEAVTDVLNGNRVLPVYVFEHDDLNDIKYIKLNGKTVDKYNRNNYIKGQTKIYTDPNSSYHYVFFAFPDGRGDPFGYLEKDSENMQEYIQS